MDQPLFDSQLTKIKDGLEKEGYLVKKVEDSHQIGFTAEKKVGNLLEEVNKLKASENAYLRMYAEQLAAVNTDLMNQNASAPNIPGSWNPLNEFLANSIKSYRFEKGLWFDKHKISGEIDLTQFKGIQEQIKLITNEPMKMRLLVTLPFSSDEHNASATADDGKTLIWNIKFGEKNPIYFDIRQPNLVTWGIALAFALIAFVSLIRIVVRRTRKV